MKTPKKVVVSKKITDQQILSAERWTFFLSQCAIDWESLSEESRDFFASMGSTESSEDDINNAIDLARGVK